MGIPLDIFSLHRFRGADEGCEHYLLLRVLRPGFSNADANDYERADAAMDNKRSALMEAYKARTLALECAGAHAASLVGELQSRPVGDVLTEGEGRLYVDVWVAATRYGHPWVVLGTAESEEEFWREVGLDEDLSGLRPTPPAKRRRAYFLAERTAADS
jgi:hypothetical protein